MIIVRIVGGIGNQLFVYSYAKNLERKGYKVYLDTKRPYRNYKEERKFEDRECELSRFNISLKEVDITKIKKWNYLRNTTLLDKFWMGMNRMFPLKQCFIRDIWSDYKQWKFNLKKNYYLWGTFQSEKICSNNRKILLEEFTLKNKLKINNYFKDNNIEGTKIAVHIRRGDYVIHKNEFGLCSLAYYRKAIQFMKEKIEEPVFLLFSNDLNWVKKNLLFEKSDKVFYVNEDNKLTDYEELYLMSMCQHNIIANSSFSWWGAWLNQNREKIVIAPRVWFKSNPSYNILPKEWIKM